MLTKIKRYFGIGDGNVYVPTDPAEAENFDPDYVPSPDDAGNEVAEVGDIPDAEVNK